jgi:hypothetical protein
MRKRFDVQYSLGQTPIEQIAIPTKSRDELPPVLAALQWVFTDPQINEEVFAVLEASICHPKKATGRPGMDLWHILVLAVVRLALDCDYDRLELIANHDSLVRAILGVHDEFGKPKKTFSFKTIRNNVALLDEATLGEINAIIVVHGREVMPKKRAKKSRPR